MKLELAAPFTKFNVPFNDRVRSMVDMYQMLCITFCIEPFRLLFAGTYKKPRKKWKHEKNGSSDLLQKPISFNAYAQLHCNA